jgi:hypothetical protein
MSNRMKFIRFIFIVATFAAIGITIKECRSGGIDIQNSPCSVVAGNVNCPPQTFSPAR